MYCIRIVMHCVVMHCICIATYCVVTCYICTVTYYVKMHCMILHSNYNMCNIHIFLHIFGCADDRI